MYQFYCYHLYLLCYIVLYCVLLPFCIFLNILYCIILFLYLIYFTFECGFLYIILFLPLMIFFHIYKNLSLSIIHQYNYAHVNPIFIFIVYNSCPNNLNAYGTRTCTISADVLQLLHLYKFLFGFAFAVIPQFLHMNTL